jgi:predicted PurR-regulated permease PerM
MKRTEISDIFLGILTLIAVAFVLRELKLVLFPLVLAMGVAVAFRPMTIWLRFRGVPTALSIVSVMGIVAVIFGVVSAIAVAAVNSFTLSVPIYTERLARVQADVADLIGLLSQMLGLTLLPADPSSSPLVSLIASSVASFLAGLLELVGNLVLTFLYLLFLIGGQEAFPDKLRRAFSTATAAKLGEVVESVSRNVRRYLVTKTVIGLLTGFAVGVVAFLFGLDFPVFLGLIAFVLTFIPNIGSVVSTIITAAIALLQYESVGLAAVVAIVVIVVQNIFGNILEPRMLGSSLDLSPTVVLVSLIFWGWVWGVWGMVISVPLTAVFKIVALRIEGLRPIAVLLGGGKAQTSPP